MNTNCIGFLIVLLFVIKESYCNQWPNHIKRCSYTNKTEVFNKCFKDAVNHAIPHLAHGVKEWGIPSLDPFHLLTDLVISNYRRPINLTFRISNGTVQGPTYFNLRNAWFNPKNFEFNFEGIHKKLTISGNYDLLGEVISLNMKSKGVFQLEAGRMPIIPLIVYPLDISASCTPFFVGNHKIFIGIINNYLTSQKLEATGCDVDEVFAAKMVPSKKKGYMNPIISYKVKRLGSLKMWFRDSRLPPVIEEALITVANENWKRISDAMMSSMEKAFTDQYQLLLSPLFTRFPFPEIVPGTPL